MTTMPSPVENSSFWTKLPVDSTLELCFGNPSIPDSLLKPSGAEDELPAFSKNPENDKAKDELSQPELLGESPQDQSAQKISQMEVRKPGIQEMYPFKEDRSKIEVTLSFYGKLLQNFNNGYVWRTKWALPPLMVKLKQDQESSGVRSPGVEKTLDTLYFELLLVKPVKQLNRFQIVLGSIRGSSKKKLVNGSCEFKGIKIHTNYQGEKYQFLLLSYFLNPDNKSRECFEVYISPEVTVYNEAKIVQIQRVEQFQSYFEVFDPDDFEKQGPKIRSEKIDTPQRQFENYLFKKTPKVKNIIYLAVKFPEVIEIYVNTDLNLLEAGVLKKGFCREIMEWNTPELGEHQNLIANYIDPEGKLLMKVNCCSTQLSFFVNKCFTSKLSIILAQEEKNIPSNYVKIDNIEALKQDYIDYCSRLHSEIRNLDQGEDMTNLSDDLDSDNSNDSNSYNENDDRKTRKKKIQKRKQEKYNAQIRNKTAVPDADRSAARNIRTRRRDRSTSEESLFKEEDLDDDSGKQKRTRSSINNGRKRKLRDRVNQKNKGYDNKFKKDNQRIQPNFNSMPMPMPMPISMPDASGMINLPFGFSQMPGQVPGSKNGMLPGIPAGMYMPNFPTAQPNTKYDTKTMPQMLNAFPGMGGMPSGMAGFPVQGIQGLNQYGMPIMMTPEMMKSMFGANINCMPPGSMPGIPTVGASTATGSSAPTPGSQSGPKIQTKTSQDKLEESRQSTENYKKSMQMMMMSQLPVSMYSMPGAAMMSGIGTQTNQAGVNTRSGQPQPMTAATLPSSLSQNGPFIMLPSMMMANPQSQLTRTISENRKPEGSSQGTSDKKEDKKSLGNLLSSGAPQMGDLGSLPQQSLPFSIMTPGDMQQGMAGIDPMQAYSSLNMAQAMQQWQQMQQMQQMGMMVNPYGMSMGQGMMQIPQMMGMPGQAPPGSITISQPNHTAPGSSSTNKPANSDKQGQKQEDKNKQGDKKSTMPMGISMMPQGGFYMSPMGGMGGMGGMGNMASMGGMSGMGGMSAIPMGNMGGMGVMAMGGMPPNMQGISMQQLQQMMGPGSFGMPSVMVSRDGQPPTAMPVNMNWQGGPESSYYQVPGVSMPSMQGIPGMQGMQGMPMSMLNLNQMMPGSFMTIPGQSNLSNPLNQSRGSQPAQGQPPASNSTDKRRKEDKK